MLMNAIINYCYLLINHKDINILANHGIGHTKSWLDIIYNIFELNIQKLTYYIYSNINKSNIQLKEHKCAFCIVIIA
jgi:hypothetical protein